VETSERISNPKKQQVRAIHALNTSYISAATKQKFYKGGLSLEDETSCSIYTYDPFVGHTLHRKQLEQEPRALFIAEFISLSFPIIDSFAHKREFCADSLISFI